jgi:hypothetical protein
MTAREPGRPDLTDQVREWLHRLLQASGPERSRVARELSRLGVWTRIG